MIFSININLSYNEKLLGGGNNNDGINNIDNNNLCCDKRIKQKRLKLKIFY